jgi:hypothetical protein
LVPTEQQPKPRPKPRMVTATHTGKGTQVAQSPRESAPNEVASTSRLDKGKKRERDIELLSTEMFAPVSVLTLRPAVKMY